MINYHMLNEMQIVAVVTFRNISTTSPVPWPRVEEISFLCGIHYIQADDHDVITSSQLHQFESNPQISDILVTYICPRYSPQD